MARFSENNFVAPVLRVGIVIYIRFVEEVGQSLIALNIFLRLQIHCFVSKPERIKVDRVVNRGQISNFLTQY